jgi:hypothetical protein
MISGLFIAKAREPAEQVKHVVSIVVIIIAS